MLTQDTLAMVEGVLAQIENTKNALLDLIDKEKGLNGGRSSENRRDKLKVQVNHLDSIQKGVQSIYS